MPAFRAFCFCAHPHPFLTPWAGFVTRRLTPTLFPLSPRLGFVVSFTTHFFTPSAASSASMNPKIISHARMADMHRQYGSDSLP